MTLFKGINTSIRGKLAISYGILMALFLLIFIFFNGFLIQRLKNGGIDNWLEQQTMTTFESLEILTQQSIRQRIELENHKLLDIVETLYDLSQTGVLTDEEARTRALELVREASLGESGYSYVLSTEGIMLSHPVESYRGKDLSWDYGIKKQMNLLEAFFTYERQNPGDQGKRSKILYMDRFTPWRWIISTTAYDDDKTIIQMRTDSIRPYIQNHTLGDSANTFIIDTAGRVVIAPAETSSAAEFPSHRYRPYLEKMMNTISGRMEIPLGEQSGLVGAREILYYHYFPNLDWLIITRGLSSELYRLVYLAYGLLLLAAITLILLFTLLNNWISRQLTRPVIRLSRFMDEKSPIAGAAAVETVGDEIDKLESHFHRFLKAQEESIRQLQRAQQSIRRLAKFPDENPNPVLRLNNEGILEYANEAAQKDVLRPLDLKLEEKLPAKIFQEMTEFQALSRKNEFTIGDAVYSFALSRISDPPGLYLYGQEITQQKKFESLQLLSSNIFENSIEGIVITDPLGNIESVNPAFTKITGYSEDEAIGKNPRILKSHRHNKGFYSEMWRTILSKGIWNGEIWNRRKDGSVYPEWLSITSLRDDHGEITQFISFFHDLTTQKKQEEQLHYESTHDPLTELPNRTYLQRSLEYAVRTAGFQGLSFPLLYLDINNFKRVNESLGLQAGDTLLRESARRLREYIKPPSTLARVGSDEFVILMPESNHEETLPEIVDDIKRIFSSPFIIQGHSLEYDFSIGVAVYPDDGTEPASLIANAEMAMREAKKHSGAPFSYHNPKLNILAVNRLEQEAQLRRAVEEQGFYLLYQPKIGTQNGKVMGTEALIRMDPTLGPPLRPDIFIPLAEEIGLIENIGTWALETACRQTQQMQEETGLGIPVAVNLSAREFANPELIPLLENILETIGMDPALLNLEITERMAIDDVDHSLRMMQKLTNLGLSLSMDDFGTGYSSLAYLTRFPLDVLKIDKSFIDGIPDDPKKTGIVRTVLSLAENLNMHTVAEGVETETQFNYLHSQSCDLIQGYYFYKPLTIEELKAVLTERNPAP